MREDHKAVFVYTTWPDPEVAKAAGRQLVDRGAAACVNIIPGMVSIYRWKGATHSDGETVMIVKTVSDALAEVEDIVRAAHPAEVPAMAVLPVVGGGADFLNWISANAGLAGRGHRPT